MHRRTNRCYCGECSRSQRDDIHDRPDRDRSASLRRVAGACVRQRRQHHGPPHLPQGSLLPPCRRRGAARPRHRSRRRTGPETGHLRRLSPGRSAMALWRQCPDPTFLADPRRGSPHSRGVAVDLSLADRETGATLDMGTGFDDLTPRAFHGSAAPTPAAQRNRMLLLGLMASAGWDHYLNEWWHYQMFTPRRYPLALGYRCGHRVDGTVTIRSLFLSRRSMCIALATAIIVATGSSAALAADSAVILIYHRFGEDSYPSTSVTIAQLEAQHRAPRERWLQRAASPEIFAVIDAGQPLPERTVGITVDDATRSTFEEAWPRFRGGGFPVHRLRFHRRGGSGPRRHHGLGRAPPTGRGGRGHRQSQRRARAHVAGG